MRKQMQDIINNEACEEMDPSSDSVHTGDNTAALTQKQQQQAQPGRTTPPTSLAIMPDHIFGCGPDSTAAAAAGRKAPSSTTVTFRDNNGGGLESPSRVLGGSTSWTGGLSHGCTAVFKNNETTTATTSVPLASPGSTVGANGTPQTPSVKLELWKNWTISTYKCSRQTILEKMGKTTRTVDIELESQIDALRDTQRKYSNVLRLARALTSHFYHVVQTQNALGEVFADLSNKSPELQDEFLYNADTQKALVKGGEQLISALNFFVSSVNTLCHKTMEDSIDTVRRYETARVEYDAYRSDLEFYATAPKTEVNQNGQRETQEKFERQKEEFEKLRSDVQIKLKFLDKNRIKVMNKQLLLFHNAISAYFSGNQKALDATMKQFAIKFQQPKAIEDEEL